MTLLLAGTAAAQGTSPDARLTLWGSVGTEAYIAPGVSLGLSAPLGQIGSFQTTLRGTAGLYILPIADLNGPLPLVNADVLFSGTAGQVNVYGGPSLGTLAGAVWFAGVTGGVRGQFGESNLGWFSEARVRAGFVPGSGTPLLPLVGGGFGLTYRF
ncbi:hypothetical protein GO986_04820 [Deinococcus sp. HMF7620]|uniref:Uncharacterized protein n=1 Tax=Deinococcus arboris TaxID=2682977 RepID=A0A7C9M0H4_9DEIO|nr:hypothetical protein [Deinococcus arboris]MVN86082.1 hypothetical protein [Deinococcus arboris]